MGIQGVRVQHFGAEISFADVYGDGLTRWEQEVWAKPLLLHPGDYQQWGWALAMVNHGNKSINIEASMVSSQCQLRLGLVRVKASWSTHNTSLG
jgi:hypothetical protein